jgi:hypothetical protein
VRSTPVRARRCATQLTTTTPRAPVGPRPAPHRHQQRRPPRRLPRRPDLRRPTHPTSLVVVSKPPSLELPQPTPPSPANLTPSPPPAADPACKRPRSPIIGIRSSASLVRSVVIVGEQNTHFRVPGEVPRPLAIVGSVVVLAVSASAVLCASG